MPHHTPASHRTHAHRAHHSFRIAPITESLTHHSLLITHYTHHSSHITLVTNPYAPHRMHMHTHTLRRTRPFQPLITPSPSPTHIPTPNHTQAPAPHAHIRATIVNTATHIRTRRAGTHEYTQHTRSRTKVWGRALGPAARMLAHVTCFSAAISFQLGCNGPTGLRAGLRHLVQTTPWVLGCTLGTTRWTTIHGRGAARRGGAQVINDL